MAPVFVGLVGAYEHRGRHVETEHLAVLRSITVSYLVGASSLRMRIDVAGGAQRSRVRGRERALILQGVRNRQAGWRKFPGCACR